MMNMQNTSPSYYLTLTSVVFEHIHSFDGDIITNHLTLTSVVFEHCFFHRVQLNHFI